MNPNPIQKEKKTAKTKGNIWVIPLGQTEIAKKKKKEAMKSVKSEVVKIKM